jgi:uncharacterized LabA/DUF88 family protein
LIKPSISLAFTLELGLLMATTVPILVDGGFYLKRYKKQPDGKQVAKGLLTHCLKHIHNQSENNDRHITEPERLYRIFFYDCPPITKKLHHPITKKAVDFKTSKTALNLY